MNDYLQRAPFVRILIAYIVGIVAGPAFQGLSPLLFLVLMTALLAALILTGRKTGYYRNILVGVLISLLLACAGITCVLSRNKTESWPAAQFYTATLLEKPVEKPNSYRSEALVIRAGSPGSVAEIRKKIVVYFDKKYCSGELSPGSVILFNRTPQEVEGPSNPYEFDYRKYLQGLGIERQVYLTKGDWLAAGDDDKLRMRVLAEKTRDRLMEIYSRNGIKGDEYEILSALTLGYKKSLDQDIRDAFKSTGSMHVLAVSGLHVGIIYMVFNLVFGFLRRSKPGKVVFLLLAVITLWMFAFLTGLSPSVQRSALMFSMVLAGENLRRSSNIYNTLASSAFILLVINPGFLYDIGFQLSYAAVAGIVYFQPKLARLTETKPGLLKYFVDLLNVTIAAQIATFPLTCFYFHQFPVYFWLANFFVIPGSFVFIVLGVVILITSPIPVVSGFLAVITGFLVRLLYALLQLIEGLPGALLTGFHFTIVSLVITCFFLGSLVLFFEFRKSGYFFAMLIFIAALFVTDAITRVTVENSSGIIAYKFRKPVIHLIAGRTNYLVASAGVLQNDFPAREVKAVSGHLGLKDPVMVPFEENYADALLVKNGRYILFNGEVLVFQHDYKGKEYLSDPGWFLDITPPVTGNGGAGEGTVVVFRNTSGYEYPAGKVYDIRKNGAWLKPLRRADKIIKR